MRRAERSAGVPVEESMFKKLLIVITAALCFGMGPFAARAEGENQLANGDFAQGYSGWETDEYVNDPLVTVFAMDEGPDGFFAYIQNVGMNDARFVQEVEVEPDTLYRLSGYIQTQDMSMDGWGANLSFGDTFVASDKIHGTHEAWKYVEVFGRTDKKQKTVKVFVRVGGYGGESMGEAWFRDVSLEKVEALPAGAEAESLATIEPKKADSSQGSNTRTNFLNPMLLISVAFLLVYFFLRRQIETHELTSNAKMKTASRNMVFMLAIGLAVRLVLALTVHGYSNDIACWMRWADQAASGGLSNFYSTPEMFVDYPPGYIYVLSAIGHMVRLFRVPYGSNLHEMLVKLPSILADILLAWGIFKLAGKRLGAAAASGLALLWLLNPAVLVDSAAWGQVDSLLALVVGCFVGLLYKKKYEWAAVVFAVGLLFKPQMLFAAPAVIPAVIFLWREKGAKITLRRLGVSILAMGATFALLALPFGVKQPSLEWLWGKYVGSTQTYPFATINATNLMMLFGGNWKPVGQPWMGIPYMAWGMVGLGLTIVYFIYLSVRDKKRESVFFHTATLLSGIFTLCVMMHERYMYPVLVLLLLHYILTRRKQSLGLFVVFTLTQFANASLVLANQHMNTNNPWTYIISAVVVIGFAYMAWQSWLIAHDRADLLAAFWAKGREAQNARDQEAGPAEALPEGEGAGPVADEAGAEPVPETDDLPEDGTPVGRPLKSLREPFSLRACLPKRREWLWVLALMLAYAAVAYVNVGNTRVPETFFYATKVNDSVTVDFEETQRVSMIWTYQYVLQASGVIKLEVKDADGNWQRMTDIEYTSEKYKDKAGDVYKWTKREVDFDAKSIRLTVTRQGLRFSEIVFKDENNQPIPIVNVYNLVNTADPANRAETGDMSMLFDEQELVPKMATFMNGTYFDEIYHARTAWENIHKVWPYEKSHPPLGKLFIALGVELFGMNPFGWRIVGVTFGVLMVPLMYLLSRAVFKRGRYAFIATFLFAFDFMHFTQTRIATIDTYGVFFIIAMFFFMAVLFRMSYNNTSMKKVLPVMGLCGLMFGLGAASKWIDIYAGVGLLLLYAVMMWERYREYRYAKMHQGEGEAEEALFENVRRTYWKKTALVLGCSVVFFILIPAAIYVASYIPYKLADINNKSLIKIVLENQQFMFSYHSKLVETKPHPYASPWYHWPFIIKPICYYVNYSLPAGRMTSIAAFGNPAVWWAGTVAMVWLVWQNLKKAARNRMMLFVLVGFMAQFLPWVLVPRSMFIYHYFASVPFFILAIVMLLRTWETRNPKFKKWTWVYLGVVLALFVFFYPLLSGANVSHFYGQLMKWLPTWNIVY